MLKPKRMSATRIVATQSALDTAQWSDDTLVLRIAPDEALAFPPTDVALDDKYAIVTTDSSFAGVWVDSDTAATLLSHHCEWEVPRQRPALAQGSVAGLATKLWLEEERVLFLVLAAYSAEFTDRLSH